MDAQRAQEILSMDTMVDVTYNGEKVYIEHVDQEVGQATVHPLDNPATKHSVSVDQLTER
ncbi:H-type small acid-soluble spore protein [Alteribacillus iranensis]|uniref:Small, acid-soluble spore protein H n=1 Tax=Alteribacillus iranensis TaxID=930128 RepID=A0A1I2EWM0_9BACI|nr:H-type small acid-soluble spore protein [Alteribacillus iranensis]SFE97179.1 small acid-soluble spore protein H (minor) [Alteribacillus iranensis]